MFCVISRLSSFKTSIIYFSLFVKYWPLLWAISLTGRNHIFPYFWNVAETCNSMFPLCLTCTKSGPVPLYTQQRKREKRHETGNGNTGYPSCFQNGLTCFCHVSVYGFLQFRPVTHRTSESLPSNFQCLMTLTNCLFSPQKSRFLSVNMALYLTL